MTRKGKHLDVIVIVTNGHDLLPRNTPILSPTFHRVSFRTPLVEHVDNGKVSQRISRRFALSPSTLPTFVRLAGTLTGARLYVRSGSHQLAGSSSPGPSRIPSSGTITYGRARYRVISFMAPTSVGPVRVYVLVR